MLTGNGQAQACVVASLGECDAFLRGFALGNILWLLALCLVLWCHFRRPR